MNKTNFAAVAIALTVPVGVAQAEQMHGDNAMSSATTESDMQHQHTADPAASQNAMSKARMSNDDMTTANVAHDENALSVHQSDSGVAYIVGGTGNQSQKTLEKHADQYSLHLVTVSGDAYVTNTHVQIMNAANQTVLDTMADAPMVYADLEPGIYVVKATLDDKSETRKIGIADTGSQTLRLSFHGTNK